jgi:hypothetical protein
LVPFGTTAKDGAQNTMPRRCATLFSVHYGEACAANAGFDTRNRHSRQVSGIRLRSAICRMPSCDAEALRNMMQQVSRIYGLAEQRELVTGALGRGEQIGRCSLS